MSFPREVRQVVTTKLAYMGHPSRRQAIPDDEGIHGWRNSGRKTTAQNQHRPELVRSTQGPVARGLIMAIYLLAN